jgi:hypothetical protein
MKTFLVILAAVLIFVGWAFLAFGTAISIGYGLYSWAVADVVFKVALWTAFITWVKLVASGFVSLFVGFCITASVK